MVSFGKISKQERQEIVLLTYTMQELDREMLKIIDLQAKTRYAIGEFWMKIGGKYNIDASSISYAIDKDNNIVMSEAKI